jgi:hypothetical protein
MRNVMSVGQPHRSLRDAGFQQGILSLFAH